VWGLLSAGVTFAKPPTEFQAPTEMTEEQLAEAKARSRSGINDYGKDVSDKPQPFPWLAAGIFAIAFLVATPFAVRQYLHMSNEIRAKQGYGGAKGARSDD
jgi:hypothetical protein